MKKIKVTIEEVISETFEVNLPDGMDTNGFYAYLRDLWKKGHVIVANPTVTEVNAMVHDEDGVEGDWVNLHV